MGWRLEETGRHALPISMRRVMYRRVGDGYESLRPFTYYSPRYLKTITVPSRFYSDGATYAPDLNTDAWWIHDVVCRYGKFDDGTLCTNRQASAILYDILIEDGFRVWPTLWRVATYLLGGGAAREGKVY